jgi:hypothetical protein
MDIVLALPGSKSAPVAGASISGTKTAPPTGWLGGVPVTSDATFTSGAYYEYRGRTLHLETLYGAAGFTPRGRLGYHIAITPLDVPGETFGAAPLVGVMATPSKSITGDNASGDTGVLDYVFADPSYGPVIRINPDGLATYGADINRLFAVDVTFFEAKDENLGPAVV